MAVAVSSSSAAAAAGKRPKERYTAAKIVLVSMLLVTVVVFLALLYPDLRSLNEYSRSSCTHIVSNTKSGSCCSLQCPEVSSSSCQCCKSSESPCGTLMDGRTEGHCCGSSCPGPIGSSTCKQRCAVSCSSCLSSTTTMHVRTPDGDQSLTARTTKQCAPDQTTCVNDVAQYLGEDPPPTEATCYVRHVTDVSSSLSICVSPLHPDAYPSSDCDVILSKSLIWWKIMLACIPASVVFAFIVVLTYQFFSTKARIGRPSVITFILWSGILLSAVLLSLAGTDVVSEHASNVLVWTSCGIVSLSLFIVFSAMLRSEMALGVLVSVCIPVVLFVPPLSLGMVTDMAYTVFLGLCIAPPGFVLTVGLVAWILERRRKSITFWAWICQQELTVRQSEAQDDTSAVGLLVEEKHSDQAASLVLRERLLRSYSLILLVGSWGLLVALGDLNPNLGWASAASYLLTATGLFCVLASRKRYWNIYLLCSLLATFTSTPFLMYGIARCMNYISTCRSLDDEQCLNEGRCSSSDTECANFHSKELYNILAAATATVLIAFSVFVLFSAQAVWHGWRKRLRSEKRAHHSLKQSQEWNPTCLSLRPGEILDVDMNIQNRDFFKEQGGCIEFWVCSGGNSSATSFLGRPSGGNSSAPSCSSSSPGAAAAAAATATPPPPSSPSIGLVDLEAGASSASHEGADERMPLRHGESSVGPSLDDEHCSWVVHLTDANFLDAGTPPFALLQFQADTGTLQLSVRLAHSADPLVLETSVESSREWTHVAVNLHPPSLSEDVDGLAGLVELFVNGRRREHRDSTSEPLLLTAPSTFARSPCILFKACSDAVQLFEPRVWNRPRTMDDVSSFCFSHLSSAHPTSLFQGGGLLLLSCDFDFSSKRLSAIEGARKLVSGPAPHGAVYSIEPFFNPFCCDTMWLVHTVEPWPKFQHCVGLYERFVPSPPMDLTLQPGLGSIQVSFRCSMSGERVTKYSLLAMPKDEILDLSMFFPKESARYRSSGSMCNNLEFTMSGLEPDTSYVVWVHGVNSRGEGPCCFGKETRTLPRRSVEGSVARGAVAPSSRPPRPTAAPRRRSPADAGDSRPLLPSYAQVQDHRGELSDDGAGAGVGAGAGASAGASGSASSNPDSSSSRSSPPAFDPSKPPPGLPPPSAMRGGRGAGKRGRGAGGKRGSQAGRPSAGGRCQAAAGDSGSDTS